jgi:opacity protein-like surface antigen
MKPLRLSLLGTAALLAALGNAEARGWYFSLEGGGNLADDVTADFRVTDAGVTTFASAPEASFDSGWAVIAAVGYEFQGWRMEGEAAWRSNDKDQFTVLPVSQGDLNQLTAMFNMTYALPLGKGLDFAIGGGGGLAYASVEVENFVEDGDWNFAYQGIAQLNYALSPSTELVLAYRYMHVLDPSFEERGTPGYIMNFDDFSNHTLSAGVRFTFAP